MLLDTEAAAAEAAAAPGGGPANVRTDTAAVLALIEGQLRGDAIGPDLAVSVQTQTLCTICMMYDLLSSACISVRACRVLCIAERKLCHPVGRVCLAWSASGPAFCCWCALLQVVHGSPCRLATHDSVPMQPLHIFTICCIQEKGWWDPDVTLASHALDPAIPVTDIHALVRLLFPSASVSQLSQPPHDMGLQGEGSEASQTPPPGVPWPCKPLRRQVAALSAAVTEALAGVTATISPSIRPASRITLLPASSTAGAAGAAVQPAVHLSQLKSEEVGDHSCVVAVHVPQSLMQGAGVTAGVTAAPGAVGSVTADAPSVSAEGVLVVRLTPMAHSGSTGVAVQEPHSSSTGGVTQAVQVEAQLLVLPMGSHLLDLSHYRESSLLLLLSSQQSTAVTAVTAGNAEDEEGSEGEEGEGAKSQLVLVPLPPLQQVKGSEGHTDAAASLLHACVARGAVTALSDIAAGPVAGALRAFTCAGMHASNAAFQPPLAASMPRGVACVFSAMGRAAVLDLQEDDENEENEEEGEGAEEGDEEGEE